MIRSKFTQVLMGAAIAASLIGTAGVASAASILQIQFSGLNMFYNGDALYDAANIVGGQGLTGEADPLVSMSFILNGVNQGTLSNNIYADVYIPGVLGLPSGGGTIESQGYPPTLANAPAVPAHSGDYGFFDLLLGGPGAASGGLMLDLDSQVQVTYSGSQVFVNGGGTTNALVSQILPFNLSMETPIEFSFSLNNLQNVTTSGGFVTNFEGSGTGEISGPATAIPEPATLLLVGLGLLTGGAVNRRRKK